MKILYIAPQPFFTPRGTPIRTRNILSGLSDAGHEVTVLTLPMGEAIEMPGLKIVRTWPIPGIRDVPIGPSPAKFPYNLLMLFHAFFLCLFRKFDAIDAVEECAFYAVWIAALFRKPLVYHMDSQISEHLRYSGFVKNKSLLRLIDWMERATVRRSRVVITVSADLSRFVREVAPHVQVFQLEDSPLDDAFVEDPEAAEELRKSLKLGDGPAVVYTGNYNLYQGIHLLLDAVPYLVRSRPDLRVVLVGGKPNSVAGMQERAAALGIQDVVRLVGMKPVEEIPAYITLADVLVSPRTLGGNTPMKIYQYMQSGRPIVATDLSTHSTVLDPSCAVLVAPEPEAFAAGVLDLLEHPEKARALAEAAAKRVRERYGLPVLRRRVAETFAELEAEAGAKRQRGA